MNLVSGRPCQRIRSLLDAYVSNELLVETSIEIRRHLDECTDCSSAMDNRLRGKQLVKRAVESIEVPSSFRFGLFARSGPARVYNWRFATAAGMAAVLLLSVWIDARGRRQERTDALLKVGWSDHLECALGGGLPEVPPAREAMVAKLGDRYSGLLAIAERELEGYRVRKGHKCMVNGREYAHLVLQRRHSLVSVSAVRAEAGETMAGEGVSAVRFGMAVAGFSAPGHLVFLTSNDPREVVEGMAGRMRLGVRGALQSF